MASCLRNKQIEQIEAQLKCSVCLNTLRDPRVFLCQHSFCNECIINWVESTQGKSNIPCPECGAEVEVGNPPDLSQFKRMNHHVNNILEDLEHLHVASSTTDEDISATSTICGIHQGRQLKYYCTTCETPICNDCRFQDHHKHECCPIDVMVNEVKQSLSGKLATLQDQRAELDNDISNSETLKGVITEENERVHGEIMQHYQSLAETLELQKQQLLDRADLLTNQKLEVIEKKLDNDRETKDRVEKNIDDIKMIYDSTEHEKVLYTDKCVSVNIENILFGNVQLSIDDDMKFLVPSSIEDFKKSLAKSHFVVNDNVYQDYCTTSLQPKHPKKGEKAVITVTCKDSNNCNIKHGGQKIKAEFAGYAEVAIDAEIDRNDGTDVIEFLPTRQGELIVKFCINDQEAPNCMLKTTVHRNSRIFH